MSDAYRASAAHLHEDEGVEDHRVGLGQVVVM